MPQRTLTQNKTLHTLLGQTGLTAEKTALVREFTSSRTERSSEMSVDEAARLIKHLEECQGQVPATIRQADAASANQQRRRILAVAHQLRWERKDGSVDLKRVDAFCVERGYLKKPLNDYTQDELPKLINQFDVVLRKFLKAR